MISRKRFIGSMVMLTGAPMLLQACSSGSGNESYASAIRRIWQPAASALTDRMAMRRELVRYATLAASSHNTQCWKFRVEDQAISILPDFSRRTPVLDPDDHHLVVSPGCAVENLVQAAQANGLKADARLDAASGEIKVALGAARPVASKLFEAITERQCTRAQYDGKPLSTEQLKLLEIAGTGDRARILLFTQKAAMEKILAYVIEGNTAQMNDPALVKELKDWLRLGADEAVRTGDGRYSKTSGNPSEPRWLGSPIFALTFSAKSENDKYANRHGRSQRHAQSGRRGRGLATKVCHLSGSRVGVRRRPARTGGALWTRAQNAAVVAPQCAGCAGLSAQYHY